MARGGRVQGHTGQGDCLLPQPHGDGLKECELWAPGMPAWVSLKQVQRKRASAEGERTPKRKCEWEPEAAGRRKQPAGEALPKSWEIPDGKFQQESSGKPQKQLKRGESSFRISQAQGTQCKA